MVGRSGRSTPAAASPVNRSPATTNARRLILEGVKEPSLASESRRPPIYPIVCVLVLLRSMVPLGASPVLAEEAVQDGQSDASKPEEIQVAGDPEVRYLLHADGKAEELPLTSAPTPSPALPRNGWPILVDNI